MKQIVNFLFPIICKIIFLLAFCALRLSILEPRHHIRIHRKFRFLFPHLDLYPFLFQELPMFQTFCFDLREQCHTLHDPFVPSPDFQHFSMCVNRKYFEYLGC